MLKPVKFQKVTKKYIHKEIEKFENILSKESKEQLFNKTLETIYKKKLFLKDMKAITYFLGKGFIEIAFYSTDRYFTKFLETYIS